MMVYRCGFQHHLIAECRFHLTTFLGDWLVSTVGDHRDRDGTQKTIGAGANALYETYVFPTDGDFAHEEQHPYITEFLEEWGVRHATPEEANRCHVAVVGWIEEGLTPDSFPEWEVEG